MDDSLKKLKKFYLHKKIERNLLFAASIPFSFIENQNSAERTWISSRLRESNIGLRLAPRNELIGAVINKALSKRKILMLGLTYRDAKENGVCNEDLREVSRYGIRYLKPREVIEEYPEYQGYHKENKTYFK